MTIMKVAYAYVEEKGPPPVCKLRQISADLESYLEAHVNSLNERASKGDGSPPATFRTKESTARFDSLLTGDDDQFVTAAQSIASQLQKEMDKRTKKGFFVALRRDGAAEMEAAALKLDVQDKQAAALGWDEHGDPDLEAVKGLLDIPGKLQKGAVFPDVRATSDVVIGDKLPDTALYFLRALDAQQIAKPGPATGVFVHAVKEIAEDRVTVVARALESETKPTTPRAFFKRHPEVLPQDVRESVLDRIEHDRRPVKRIDPTRHAIMGTWKADGITVRGRLTDLESKFTKLPRKGGGWRMQIDVSDEPELETQ
jgi:hypothetical protein